jgi:hypothetical protein
MWEGVGGNLFPTNINVILGGKTLGVSSIHHLVIISQNIKHSFQNYFTQKVANMILTCK